MKLATSSQMQSLDQTAINDIGIPGVVLMENAGRSTVDHMEQEFGSIRDRSVIIFTGPGNNGGDGLVIARHVLQRGGFPFLVYLVSPEKLTGDAAINADICSRIDIPHIAALQEDEISRLLSPITQFHFDHPVHSMVDALFGTGLKRNLTGQFAAAVNLINTLARDRRWPVISVDIPSGLAADTGQPLGCCVQADLTVTYGLAKPGHFLHGGPAVGRLKIVDIGIPEQLTRTANLPGRVLAGNMGRRMQNRHRASHKGSFGHLLILAGSEGKTGAAILSAKAALHSGCGLVSMAVPAGLNPIFETNLPEAMTIPLPASATSFSMADHDLIVEMLTGKDGLVIGPGLGTNPDTGALVRSLYCNVHLPMVVDADALNLLALETECIPAAGGPRILTPHPGEMTRLTGLKTGAIQSDRLYAANWLAAAKIQGDNEIITVLKGAGTVICSSRGRWAINSSGNSGMAAGGMGDVLSGLIGGLLVQGYAPCDAAELGVYMHGLAADLLAAQQPYGYLASEVAAALPLAAANIQSTI